MAAASQGRQFLAAAVQLRSTADQPNNLARTEALVRRAAGYGAKLICTPENTPFLGPAFHKVELAEAVERGNSLFDLFSSLSKELGVYLLCGSLSERYHLPSGEVSDSKCYNTSVLFGPKGEKLAHYRKIHLFDVDVPNGPSLKESNLIEPGSDVVVCDTELGRIGLSVCYDLRFPELYARLVNLGAEIIVVPAAFTSVTGKDHWHPLLTARAIETQSFVIASAQWGTHDEKGLRQSYGHSLIVDPWGCPLADAGEGEGLALAEIKMERLEQVRAAIPVQSHRRLC